MPKIEIGSGVLLAALAGTQLQGSISFTVVLLIIGLSLVVHGCYDVFFKPNLFLENRLRRWLVDRDWKVSREHVAEQHFFFALWAEDDSGRKLLVARTRREKGILAFTALVPMDAATEGRLGHLTDPEKKRIVEEIHVLLATMKIGWAGGQWPLDKLTIQTALPLDQDLSEHLVDATAKQVAHALAAARSTIRKAVAHVP